MTKNNIKDNCTISLVQPQNEPRPCVHYSDDIISQLKAVQFLNRAFYPYEEAMKALMLSDHPHQLLRRIENYPNEIITIQAVSYISINYFNCLAHLKASLTELMTLKNGGVPC